MIIMYCHLFIYLFITPLGQHIKNTHKRNIHNKSIPQFTVYISSGVTRVGVTQGGLKALQLNVGFALHCVYLLEMVRQHCPVGFLGQM